MQRTRSTRLAVAAAALATAVGLGAAVLGTGGTSNAAVGDIFGPDWGLVGNASIDTNNAQTPAKVVRLTSTSPTYQKGWAVYNPTIPTTAGVDVSFAFAEWAPFGTSSIGYDGISFWVQDARQATYSSATDFGTVGYALGYAPVGGNGLASALLAVGFAAGFDDAPADGSGCTTSFTRFGNVQPTADRKNTITLRGGPGYGGSRTGPYCLLADSVVTPSNNRFNEAFNSRAAATRYARITIDPSGTVNPKVKVFYGSTPPALTDTPIITADAPANLLAAADLRIGFAGSTGAGVNNNEVWGFTSSYATYNVTVDLNDGTTTPTSTVYAQTPTSSGIALSPPTRAGYTFAGWYDAASGGTQLAGPTATSYTPTGTVTLYAQWIADSSTTTSTSTSTSTTSTTSTSTTSSTLATTTTLAGTTTTTAATTTTSATTTTLAGTTTSTTAATTTTMPVVFVVVPPTTTSTSTSTTSIPPAPTSTTTVAAPAPATSGPSPTLPSSVAGTSVTGAPAYTGSDSLDLVVLALALMAIAGLVFGGERLSRRNRTEG